MKIQFTFLKIVVTFLLFNSPYSNAEQTLTLVALDNYAPFSWQENGQAKGNDIEIVNELCTRLKINCIIKFIPWKRALIETEHGNIDGIIGAFTSAERDKFAHSINQPLHYTIVKAFIKETDKLLFRKIEDLKGEQIGINRGFHFSKQLDKATKSHFFEVQFANDSPANLAKLMQGRIKGFVGNFQQTMTLLEELSLAEQIIPIPSFAKTAISTHIIISKKATIKNKAVLLRDMNLVLKSMYQENYFHNLMKSPK